MANETKDLTIVNAATEQKVIDWRNEAVVLFVRLPVVALFAGFGYIVWELTEIWLADNSAHIQALTQIVSQCAGQ